MKPIEHLLVTLIEECAEVSQNASKALRFGLLDCHPAGGLPNVAKLADEIDDLMGAIRLLQDARVIRDPSAYRIERKCLRVREWMDYARQVGALQDEPVTTQVSEAQL